MADFDRLIPDLFDSTFPKKFPLLSKYYGVDVFVQGPDDGDEAKPSLVQPSPYSYRKNTQESTDSNLT